jgi:hypothetical protein
MLLFNKLTFIGILFLHLQPVLGQTVIKGSVKDKKGEPLAGANIYLPGTYDGVSSDIKGQFEFSTEEKGKRILKIDFIGFEGFEQEIDLDSDVPLFDVVLKEKFNQMSAVVITAGYFEAGDEKRSATLNSLDMVTTAGANGDIYGALQTLPGTTNNPESGRLFVKGGTGEESQTYIDGTLVLVPYTSSPPLTSTFGRFDPFMFRGTIFSTGGYSAEYGQALSSVLLLRTNDMPDEESLNISLLSVGGGLAGTKKWNNGAVRSSVNYTNLEPYMAIAPQHYEWNQAPEYLSADMSIRQKTGKAGLLKLYGNFNNTRMSLNQTNLNEDRKPTAYDLKNDNFYVNGSWQNPIGKNWIYRTGISITENQDKVTYGRVNFEEKLRGLHLKNLFIHQLSPKVSIRMGTDLFAKEFIHTFLEGKVRYNSHFTELSAASFAEAETYLSNKFVMRAGGRAEYSVYLRHASFSPRFSSAYKFNDKSLISLAYGWFTQNPMNEYLVYTDQLKPERADHYILTFQTSENRRLLRSEVYYKDYRDLVKTNTETFYLPQSYNNTGKGYAYGLDIFWRDKKTIRNAEYWVSYSYLNSERDFRDYPYMVVPSFVSNHNISVVYKYWIHPIRSLPGITYRYSSPRFFHDPNLPGFSNRKTIPFNTLDVNISYLHREHIIFYAGVSNLFGFRQEYGERFADKPNADGIYESERIIPGADRFFVIACFITLSKRGDINQLEKIQ